MMKTVESVVKGGMFDKRGFAKFTVVDRCVI